MKFVGRCIYEGSCQDARFLSPASHSIHSINTTHSALQQQLFSFDQNSTRERNPISESNTHLIKPNTKNIYTMAPINRLASPVMRMAAQKRSFGIMQRVRHQLRSFEPHPFERYPTTTSAAKADWGRQFKKLGDSAMLYVPPPPSSLQSALTIKIASSLAWHSYWAGQ